MVVGGGTCAFASLCAMASGGGRFRRTGAIPRLTLLAFLTLLTALTVWTWRTETHEPARADTDERGPARADTDALTLFHCTLGNIPHIPQY